MKKIYKLYQIANFDGEACDVDLSYDKTYDINEVYTKLEQLINYWKNYPQSKWKFEIREMS